METHKNLTIIGTSHISIESVKDVKEAFKKINPSIIALELDKKRFFAIQNEGEKLSLKDIFSLGFRIFLLNLIGAWIEKKLGEKVGMKPGSEMIEAIKLAKEKKTKIALIDQDVSITMRKLVKTPFKEKIKLLLEIIKGVIFKKGTLIKFDLRRVPPEELIEKMTKELRDKYPYIYRVLIKERNVIMAKRINHLMTNNKQENILVVIGAGHKKEILEMIKNGG
ncbi:MAG: TraB/GumN family protein [Candidatus Woesearchaeota archaeon]|nr:MAG: TraB/GumN family protein [Candidatus Woesearchaeota archaeon]